MAYDVEQVYTDNPFVDIIVYNTKILALGTVLKMKNVADANETKESLENAEMYIACMEGTYIWDIFDSFSENVLRSSGITGAALGPCLIDKENIPADKRSLVMQNQAQEIIDNYAELNNYYRMLYGLPPIGYKDIYVTDWTPPEGIDIDLSIPVHEMTDDNIYILEQNDVLDEMYSADPTNRAYLRYLTKKISPYAARKASAFYPIYVPTIDSTELSDEYKDRLEINRKYAVATVYSEAYRFESDYYDNFIAVFIILNTMVDMISRVQEFIARKEVIDLRTCRYIFEANGVPYYPEIPLRYQIRMVKNLHQLLKYKSTPKCMIEICSLFGFDNITIFKYYLLRIRTKGDDGEYSFTGDPNKDFELKFVKIPVDEPMDEYIRDPKYQVDYDEITVGDATWDGGLNHDDVKLEHKKLEFNYTRTKYLSVDSIYDLAKIAIQQSYFYNMLYDNVEAETLIGVTVPMITSARPINICDLFTFLTVLTFRYYGIDDRILDTASKVLYVNGFNFKADLAELATQLANMGITRKHMGRSLTSTWTQDETAVQALNDFILPEGQIPSFNQLMNIFTNNLDVRDILAEGMRKADNKRVYDMFKILYDSLMTIELTMDHFADPETGELYRDDEGNATYTVFLMHKDPVLYYKIQEIDLIDDEEERLQQITNLIDSAVFAIEEYIDSEKFAGIFHKFPAVSVDAVKEYIQMVVDFYKSYKVHFLGVNTIYTYDDKWDGWVKIIDDAVAKKITFDKNDIVPVTDLPYRQSNKLSETDKVYIEDKAYFDISTWIYLAQIDRLTIEDAYSLMLKLSISDNTTINDDFNITSLFGMEDKLPMIDIRSQISTTMTPNDSIGINDAMVEMKITNIA